MFFWVCLCLCLLVCFGLPLVAQKAALLKKGVRGVLFGVLHVTPVPFDTWQLLAVNRGVPYRLCDPLFFFFFSREESI